MLKIIKYVTSITHYIVNDIKVPDWGSIRSKVPPKDNESAQIKIYCLTKILDASLVSISDVDGYELSLQSGYQLLPSS